MAEVKAVLDMLKKNPNAVATPLPPERVIIIRGAESTCNVTIARGKK